MRADIGHVFVVGFSCLLFSAASIAEEGLTPQEWAEDIDYWYGQLQTIHIDPFHTVSQAELEDELSRLKARLPALTDGAIALECSRIAALVGDGHTWISPHKDAYQDYFPIQVYPFADGVYVVRATAEQEDLLGKRLLSVEGVNAQTVLDAAGPYVGRDNEWTVLSRSPGIVNIADFLHTQGFTPSRAQATFTFKDATGETTTRTLQAIDAQDLDAWSKLSPGNGDPPLYLRRLDEAYWMEYLGERKTLFVKFNSVRNHDDGPHLARFSQDIVAAYEKEGAEYLIFDVRHNGGGNGDLLVPLIRRMSNHETINRPGHLFVITSRHTFSAALMFTARMERNTEAVFVGEPGGGKPNSYGETNEVLLPHSQLRGSISSRFHAEGEPGDTRDFIPVDIDAPRTGGDYITGRDPVLDAIVDLIVE